MWTLQMNMNTDFWRDDYIYLGCELEKRSKCPLPWKLKNVWDISMNLGFQSKQTESIELRCLDVDESVTGFPKVRE